MLGSWVVLGMAIAALIFSVACFYMIRESLRVDNKILQHVLKFDPNYINSRLLKSTRETAECDDDKAKA